jgi:hypothetical protein
MYRTIDRYEETQRTLGHIVRGVLCGLLVFVPLMLYGCAEIHTRIGRQPDIDVLEKKLRIGESTSAEVRAALGEPFGKGREMSWRGEKPRMMWSYYYEEGDLKDARRIFLFVYFDQDRYDGYMWFSSLPKK